MHIVLATKPRKLKVNNKMPIERELKYVLRPCTTVVTELRKYVRDKGWKYGSIHQAYIGPGARIRNKTVMVPGTDSHGREFEYKEKEYTFTYKCDMPDFSVVEIESDISEDDYICMEHAAETILFKERVSKTAKMDGDDGEAWDIDMFFSHSEPVGYLSPYCILAECELFGDRRAPTKLPGVVSRNLIHAVRPGDKAMSSRSLANVDKTTQIMRVLVDLADAQNA